MTNNAIDILKMIFNMAYSFMTGFIIPGTRNVTPLALLLFSTFAYVLIKFIKDSLEGANQ